MLQDLLNCDGSICEGEWEAALSNTGLSFDQCNNSVTITDPNVCGTFSISSDGTGSSSQCGVYSIIINIGSASITAASITASVQPECDNNNDPPAITSSGATGNPVVVYQWQMSTTSCTDGFTDIAGATMDSYDPPVLTQETHYRLVTSAPSSCGTGACEEISNCVTLTPEEGCCPIENCFDIVVTRN